MMNKKRAIWAFVLALFILTFALILFNSKPEKEQKKEEAVYYEPAENDLNNFKLLLRRIYTATLADNDENLISEILTVENRWSEIRLKWYDQKPSDLAKTEDWLNDENEIAEFFIKMRKAAEAGEPGVVVKEHDNIKTRLGRIYKENNLADIGDEMDDVLRAILRIKTNSNKDEITAVLPEIKISFGAIKERYADQEYRNMISDLEKIIGDLDRLLPGPDLWQARDNLQPVFLEIYYKWL